MWKDHVRHAFKCEKTRLENQHLKSWGFLLVQTLTIGVRSV